MSKDLDIRWKQRFSSFEKAFAQMEEAINVTKERELNDLENKD